jgi:hypothetical protein
MGQARLYFKPGVNVGDFDGNNPQDFFSIVRGASGGLCSLPPEIQFKDQLDVADIRRHYFDPRTLEFFDLAWDEDPPEITHTPPGGHTPVKMIPAVEWYVQVDPVKLAAKSETQAVVEKIKTYRQKRRDAYVERLGKDSDTINAIGDVLDVLIRRVAALEAVINVTHNLPKDPEWSAALDTIKKIKQEIPKS